MGGKASQGVWDGCVNTAILKMDNQQGPTENSGQRYVRGWMGGEFGREWIHVYVWLSPFAVHPKLSQCC